MADDQGEIPKHFRKRFVEREAEIATKLQPGDELWEYETGALIAFAGTSGLAVVRGGRVVESWCEWKS